MAANPFLSHSTPELLTCLSNGELTSRQLVESCLEQIRLQNPTLNAFVNVDEQNALIRADRIDARRRGGESLGILCGLPLGIKDNLCRTDTLTTCGQSDAGIIPAAL